MKKEQKNENYETFSQNLDSEIDNVISRNFSKKEIQKLNSPLSKYFSILNLLSFVILFAGFIIFAFGQFWSNWPASVSVVILLFLAIPAIVCFLFRWSHYRIINKLFAYFENPQSLEPFYNHYSNFLKSAMTVENTSYNEIETAMRFFPIKGFPQRNITNIYLSGFYQDYNFKIGTNTYSFEKSDGNRDYYLNEEHLYLYAKIDKTNFQTALAAKEGLSKIFTSKKARESALESEEFEKKFKIDHHSDPIKLRKLLSPRVMENLINLAKTQKIPEIFINDDEIIVHQVVRTSVSASYYGLESLKQKYYFGYLQNKRFSKIDDIKTIIKKTIAQDFEKMNYYLKWVDAFKLHLNYEIKMFKQSKK